MGDVQVIVAEQVLSITILESAHIPVLVPVTVCVAGGAVQVADEVQAVHEIAVAIVHTGGAATVTVATREDVHVTPSDEAAA